MLRELFVSIYLFIFKLIFSIFSINRIQKKTVFIATFKDDIHLLNVQLKEDFPEFKRVILQDNRNLFKKQETDLLLNFSLMHPLEFVKSIYHLSTASHIILDNYYGFLAVVNFKSSVKRVQVWHANGAFKKFGLEDLSNKNRSQKAIKRFKKVYNNFTHIIVSSDKMKNIFTKSFDNNSVKYLKTGMPRTDFYFSVSQIETAKQRLLKAHTIDKNKKVLFYAPTYRDNQLNQQKIHLDIKKLRAEFNDQYTLLIRLHPTVQRFSNIESDDFVIDVSSYPYLKDLLTIADVLITDYSSIPFEFGLLRKPMIFYTYDFESYQKSRGLIDNFREEVPGPIVSSSSELIKIIKNKRYDFDSIESFEAQWNTFSNGKATENIIHKLYD